MRACEQPVAVEPEHVDCRAVVMHYGKPARVGQHTQMTRCVAGRVDLLPHAQSITVDTDHRDAALSCRRFRDGVSERQTRMQHDERRIAQRAVGVDVEAACVGQRTEIHTARITPRRIRSDKKASIQFVAHNNALPVM